MRDRLGHVEVETLGQLQAALRAIYSLRAIGREARAEYWLARLRGEELMCSARGCGAAVGSLERWCARHRLRPLQPPRPLRHYAIGRAREAVLAQPDRTIAELAAFAGVSEGSIKRARRELGLGQGRAA